MYLCASIGEVPKYLLRMKLTMRLLFLLILSTGLATTAQVFEHNDGDKHDQDS